MKKYLLLMTVAFFCLSLNTASADTRLHVTCKAAKKKCNAIYRKKCRTKRCAVAKAAAMRKCTKLRAQCFCHTCSHCARAKRKSRACVRMARVCKVRCKKVKKAAGLKLKGNKGGQKPAKGVCCYKQGALGTVCLGTDKKQCGALLKSKCKNGYTCGSQTCKCK